MMNWNNPQWPLLVAVFWQTFSLGFYLTIIVFWVRPYGDNIDWQGRKKSDNPALRIPYVRKFITGMFGLVGCFGAVAVVTTLRNQVPGVDTAFGIGFPIGIGIAFLIRKGLKLQTPAP
jgi:hypothetical protein